MILKKKRSMRMRDEIVSERIRDIKIKHNITMIDLQIYFSVTTIKTTERYKQ